MNYIQEFISKNLKQYLYWQGTCLEDYPYLTPKKKGDLGELIVQTKMREYGHIVLPSTKGYNGTDDRLISGWDTEIKFSVTQEEKDGNFIINHIKTDIKWDRFIFYGYNKDKPHRFVWCAKEDMEKCWKETNWWNNQSSSEEKMCSTGNLIKWINSSYTRDIETWNAEPAPLRGLEGFMNGHIQTA